MKFHFARYGLPDIVVSDNGPQFSCQEFFQFANEFDFRHQPNSPGNSQANGKAEAAVKTAKTVLKKAKASGMDVHLALLDLRNTPCLLYTSDAADDMQCVDLGGRRIIKKRREAG